MSDELVRDRPADGTCDRARDASGPPVEGVRRPSRRRLLGLCGAAVAAVAGCSGEAGEPTDGESTDGDAGGDAGDSDGGADGDSSDGDAGGDTGDSDGGTDGESTDETAGDSGAGDGGDEASETPGGTETPDGTETASETETETAEPATATPESQPQLSEATEFPTSFAMDMTWEGQQQLELSGRFHDGDVYWQYQLDEQEMEWYLVDGSSYVVIQDQCYVGTTDQQLDEEDVDPEGFEEQAEDHPDIEPAGTDEIDGETVLVYELDDDPEDATFYVLADRGYLRRVESGDATWDFHSWGEVDPIEPPDMECQDPSDR